jgi:Na+/H+ antiporter NhaD/arsenite permease-like protein
VDSQLFALVTAAIFSVTYAGLALGRFPGLLVDRAGIALVGATLIVLTGMLSLDEAVRAIDHDTLILLFAMMIVVAYLRLAGFFERVTGWALSRLQNPITLLAVTILLAGVLSAFLVNDIVCLTMTSLILHGARRLRLNPVPYLLALATAANIGSTATITGNPQNMIIGSLAHISYARFAARLAPIAVVGLLLNFALVYWLFRNSLREDSGQGDRPPESAIAPDRVLRGNGHAWLLRKSIAISVAVVVLFLSGLPISLVALGGAALLMLDRVRPQKIYDQIDWGLLVMFAGLFVVVHAFEVHVTRQWGVEQWKALQQHPVGMLSVVSAGLSNLVSNVPAVLLFKPIIPAMPQAIQETAWLTLAMSSTLAGNLTIVGSVANLIVMEIASRHGCRISFRTYCGLGIPLTLVTLAAGVLWLYWTANW